MNYFTYGAVYNLGFDKKIIISSELIKISVVKEDSTLIKLLKSEAVMLNMGFLEYRILTNNSIHFSAHREEVKEGKRDQLLITLIGLQKYITQNFFLALWFVKDNSVNTSNFYSLHFETNSIIVDQPKILFSSSKGEYKVTLFTDEEIQKAMDWQEKIKIYIDSEGTDENEEQEFQNGIQPLFGVNNFSKKNLALNENRIRRSLRLIKIARSQSFLPAKIASYISAIEALISSNRESLVMQVAERVPKIIGGSIEEKRDNHDKIRTAYGIRNKYVHGDKVTAEVAKKLEVASEDIDSIARSLLNKMINEYDYTKDYGEGPMTKWYKENFMF